VVEAKHRPDVAEETFNSEVEGKDMAATPLTLAELQKAQAEAEP